MSTIQTNFAKWYERAAWFHASPAVCVRPLSSASRACSACISPFSSHAGSHSAHVSTRAVTRWKSLTSTPWETNRGAQLSIAACTRSSGTRHHLLDRCSEVSEHHCGCVPPRRCGDRGARVRRRAGLIEPGNRQAMLRPPRDGAKATHLRGTHLAAVTRAAPVVLVQRLEVDGTLHERRFDLGVRQVRGVATDVLEVRLGHVVLDLLPALGAAVGELVRVEADDLERVTARWRALGIGHGRADDEQWRVVDRERAAADVPADAQQAVDGCD